MKTIISLVILYLIYTSLKGYSFSRKQDAAPKEPRRGKNTGSTGDGEEMKLDPVCNNYIPVSTALTLATKEGTVYFCTDVCKDKFLGSPDRQA